MLTKYLALVSQSNFIQVPELCKIAAALQKQLTRDFTPIWEIPAAISAFASLKDVPVDYWKIIIMDNINNPSAAGYHQDSNGQPYALVSSAYEVSMVCSHEMIEMLVDPWGNRLVASESLEEGQGRVNYFVEACDPSEDIACSYIINGMRVSDFYTPNFFDPVPNIFIKYSFTGAISAPRQILPGGYIS
jgi:hypothetical protein